MTSQNRKDLFEKLIWQQDRMLLDDLVFRLQHYANDNWELRDQCFLFYKIKFLIDQYAEFWSHRQAFHARNILELGVWDGGSIAFWFEYFSPDKHVGVDLQQREDSQYFKQYKTSRDLDQRIATYWGVDQGDSARLREIVQAEFKGPLDLVIDDASHMYDLTKKSFETLFPLLRPGGLYVVEDWAWSHWPEFQEPAHPWSHEVPLTQLIFELVAATGSCQTHESSQPLISNLSLFQGFAVIERGETSWPTVSEIKLETLISGCRISLEPRVRRLKMLRMLKGWISSRSAT
jgi:Methyltransferase domain